jgi:putative ABC transport system permease protein
VIRLVLRGLWTHKLRTALTTLAILLGVAMISGTYVLTDQINAGFDELFTSANQGIDVIIAPKPPAFGQPMAAGTYLPESLLLKVKRTNGVATASGLVQGMGALVVGGKAVAAQNGPPTLVFSNVATRFTQTAYARGRPPQAAGEMSISSKFVEDNGLRLGQTIGLATPTGLHQARLVGVFTFGSSSSLGGVTMVVSTLSDMQAWYRLDGKLSAIYAAAEPAVGADALAKRLSSVVPGGAEVKTGTQSAADQSKAISDVLGKILTPALLAFGFIAVLVGAFIIFNAFSITVAQRLREFAMLRALGASRRQVLGVVVAEAAVIGLTASVVGLFTGLGIARAVTAVFGAVGADLPKAGAALHLRTIVVALAVGLLVTVIAALVPALRATRVPPVAALQEGAALPPSRVSRLTPYLAALVSTVGIAMVLVGSLRGDTLTMRLALLGGGALLVFVALGMLAKYAVRPLARVLGWPLERVSTATGRLARENAARNPARTGATAAALMIGLAVVVFVAVFAQAIKTSFVDVVEKSVKADLVVNSGYVAPLPPAGIQTIRRVPSVAAVTGVATGQVRVAGSGVDTMFAVAPGAMARVWRFNWIDGGSDRLLTQLGVSGALVEEQVAAAHQLHVGERFSVLTQAGKTARFTVVGEYRDPVALKGVVVADRAWDRLFDQRDAQLTLVKGVPGVPASTLQQSVKTAVALGYPTAEVQTRQEYVDGMTKQINQLLMLIYALLAMSVVISLFGIVNTLVLSVHERTREIGMLRAIGASRRQIRRMVRYESVITAVIGGLLGIVVGVTFAAVLVSQLGSEGITFALPAVQLLVFLVVSAFVGVLAAVLPARRAAKIQILDAIHYE